jgi:hypothetical protein
VRCGKKLNIKDWKLRRIHTAFGRVYLPTPCVMGRACDGFQRRAKSIARHSGWLARVNQDDKGSRGVQMMPLMIVAGNPSALQVLRGLIDDARYGRAALDAIRAIQAPATGGG